MGQLTNDSEVMQAAISVRGQLRSGKAVRGEAE